MAQDIRDLIKQEKGFVNDKMPLNHQERFLKKLDKALPVKNKIHFNWLQIAASIAVLVGLSFGALKIFNQKAQIKNVAATKTVDIKTLGDVSPGLKKVEDYYLASINLELSKMQYQPENKELVDSYLEQLDELNQEYKRLSLELTEDGPSELTVKALIDNLKYRLNLLYRLREQLKVLSASNPEDEAIQSI